MTEVIYIVVLSAALILAAGYVYIWHKHYDVNLTMIFTLVPIACVGYMLSATASSLEGALFAQKIVYIGGCYLQLFILFSIFNLCKLDIRKSVRAVMFLISTFFYVSVLTAGSNRLFYRSVSFKIAGGTPVLIREYGPMHTVYVTVLIISFLIGVAAIVYAWFRKKDAPKRVIVFLAVPYAICLLCYAIGKVFALHVDIIPIGYIVAEIVYLYISHEMTLYDIGDTVIDTLVHEASVGYISFDYRYRYLGSNEVAQFLVPELADISVDDTLGYKPSERKIRHYLESFKQNNADNKFLYTLPGKDGNHKDDRYYDVEVSYLFDGNKRRGYIVTFTDDTENKKYIRLLDNYNDDLRDQVSAKTKHIVQMHDNLIMSLAMMVESRDNSTGGHIKRTSDGVRILIEEIMKEGDLKLTPEFCKAVVKAAPMHDLGKIAVDDAVLRKPGKFEPEEYEKMKAHAAEGARVIHEILKNTDDENFKVIAENVAHYHHERYDGSGYPEKIKGDDIPLEARIMAIADVYDALVSKRVYKEAFGFEKADRIIMEGMGTQFDPRLKSAYERARPRLEDYYSHLETQQ